MSSKPEGEERFNRRIASWLKDKQIIYLLMESIKKSIRCQLFLIFSYFNQFDGGVQYTTYLLMENIKGSFNSLPHIFLLPFQTWLHEGINCACAGTSCTEYHCNDDNQSVYKAQKAGSQAFGGFTVSSTSNSSDGSSLSLTYMISTTSEFYRPPLHSFMGD